MDAFGYRDTSGRRVEIYLSFSPFPFAPDAHLSGQLDGPWTAATNGVDILCLEHPFPLLAVSDDRKTLQEVGPSLGVE